MLVNKCSDRQFSESIIQRKGFIFISVGGLSKSSQRSIPVASGLNTRYIEKHLQTFPNISTDISLSLSPSL